MFDWITGVIGKLGYLGVLALTFLENLFPPIPSELVIPLAGFVAAKGELNLYVVIGLASAGSLLGSTVWYVVGRRIGERRLKKWIDQHGRWLTLGTHDVDAAKSWFTRHGRAAVFLGRLMPGVRTFVSLPAGFSKMPAIPFLLYSAMGTAIWTTVLAYAGVLLQSNFVRVEAYMNVATNILIVAGVILLVRRYLRCWNGAPAKKLARSAGHA